MSKLIRYIKELEDAGFARNQAEAQISMVMSVLESQFVTKNDFDRIVAELRHDIGDLRQEVRKIRPDLETHFDLKMDSRFAQFETRLMTRLGAMWIASTTITIAALSLILKS